MKERLKENILNKPILYSFIIFMICLVIRIVEYFIIKTDTTFISENFIHKLIGIIILLFFLKVMNYKFKDIGFEKNKFFKYLIYGLILGGICFGISYFIEYITLYANSRNPSFELYVNGFSLAQYDSCFIIWIMAFCNAIKVSYKWRYESYFFYCNDIRIYCTCRNYEH